MADGTGFKTSNGSALGGRAYDAQMARFLSRRGLLRLGAAGAGAVALAPMAGSPAAATGQRIAPALRIR